MSFKACSIALQAASNFTDVLDCMLTHCDVSCSSEGRKQCKTCLEDICNATLKCAEDAGSQDHLDALPNYAVIIIVIVLLCSSGLFSGLTLGLMSLDRLNLRVSEKSGEENERKWAAAIRPLRDRGNLLLCTLLLGNTLVNSAISILLDSLTQGAVAVVVSTFVILIFGEILPQAICVRYGLAIGAVCKPLVYFFMIIFYPITWPISKVLDFMLGRDIGVVYSKQELKHLISLHCEDPDANRESGLTTDDHKLLRGAFEYKEKCIHNVMTALDKVFMLEISTRLTPQIMLEIYRQGFTRIPIYQQTKENIMGILYTKDLILIDPDDDVELSTIIGFREAMYKSVEDQTKDMFVCENTKLEEVFKTFKHRCSHMLFATDLGGIVTGVITLEDVLEELINDEIVDEMDNMIDTNHPEKVMPQRRRHDLSMFLQNMYLPASDQLSAEEVSAIVAYLVSSVNEFKCFKGRETALVGLINNHSEVIDVDGNESGHSPASSRCSREFDTEHQHRIYKQGHATDKFTLILQGKVLIESGVERFQLELGPWSKMCEKALCAENGHVPDFTAYIHASHPARLLQIERSAYLAAMHAAAFEARVGKLAVKKEVFRHLDSTISNDGDQNPSDRDFLLNKTDRVIEMSDSVANVP